MAPPPPPPVRCPNTVLDLTDDLLREVFLRLPALPSLVLPALSCTTFLSAVRSCPAFRRSFRALHPSPFLGLFVQRFGFEPEVSSFDAHDSRPDRDFEAAVRGDFVLTGLPPPDADGNEDGDDEEKEDDEDENSEEEEEEEEDASPVWEEEEDDEDENSEEEEVDEEEEDDEDENSEEEEEDEDDEDENSEEEDASPLWEIERCCDGYVVLFNQRAKQIAAYNPLTRALHLYPSPSRLFTDATNFEFHIISFQEDPGVPPCVVCFNFDFFSGKAGEAVVRVISSDGSIKSKRRKFPGAASGVTGKMVNGSVYWTHLRKPYLTVLDTTTLKFSRMDLPPLLVDQEGRGCAFVSGNTKNGRPCIVSSDLWGNCSLDVFFWRRKDEYYDDGRNYWILDQTFPLKTIRQFGNFSEGDDDFIIVRLIDVIDGIVYLRTEYDGCTEAPQLLLSFCLDTTELKIICEDYHKPVHPYIMA
ncbi:hypothetical protein ZWY2020_042154 [Hordeum vulgare]|nr:hypothetical protein ZWY2020_042154 [Hordeum vulgare]